MKFLTIFDYTNILALGISTLLMLGVQFLSWQSNALTLIMLLLLAIVVVASIKNRKYRKMARTEGAVVISESDIRFAKICMGIILILGGLVLVIPGLR